VNSVLEKREMRIEDISKDLASGVELINFLELLSGKKLDTKYDKSPVMRIQKIQNIHLALRFLEKEMEVKLVGIGAEDFVDSQTKLILGFLWSLFRKFKIATIKEEDKSSEEGLLLWVKKQTEGYPNVTVTNFKETFKNGYAFLALIDKYKEGLVDYQAMLDSGLPAEELLKKSFEVAEAGLGVPSLLDQAEVADGSVDERGLVLYVSLYFHAFMALSEREKLESSKREMTSKLESVEERLKREQAEKEALEAERRALQAQQEELASLLSKKAQNYDELAQQNDALRKALEELNAKFDAQSGELRSLKDELKKIHREKSELQEKDAYLEEKVEVLKQLLDQETDEKAELEAARAKDGASAADAAASAAAARDDLQNKLKKTQSALDKEKELREAEQKVLEKLRARAAAEQTGLELMKKHLELHVTDLHRWQKYLNYDTDAFLDFDEEAQLVTKLDTAEQFDAQVAILAAALESENDKVSKMLKEKQKSAKAEAEAKAAKAAKQKKRVTVDE
jgi:cortexillin 1/2